MIRRSERVAIQGGNGFELAGIVDWPSGAPIAAALFTHCFTCNKDLKAIVRISRGLAEAGYMVLRYDLTGLGGSQGDFSQSDFSSNQRDLLAAARFMAQQLVPPDFLIGHSFGGICSLSMVEEIPSTRGVVTVASPSDTAHLADLLEKMNPDLRRHESGSVTIGGKSYIIPQKMLADFRNSDVPARLRKISKPALLFHSPVDETLGFEHALRLFAFLSQRSAADPEPSAVSLICLPGADHLLVRNPADIEFITASIAAWFQRLMRDA